MSRAVKSEINEVGSSALVSALRADAWDAYQLKWAISSFAEGSGKLLCAPAYDEARKCASEYIPILENRAKTALELASAIKSGCSSLAGYMGKFEVLDEAERPTYEARLKEAEAQLSALSAISWDDENFDLINYWATYFRSQQIAQECREYLEKLDGLPAADSAAFGPISAAATSSVSRV